MTREKKYVGFYNIPFSSCKRVGAISAINKMDYISDAIVRAGFNVHIISPAWFDDSSANESFSSGTTIKLNKNKQITFCPSFYTNTKCGRNIKISLSLIWLFFWLINNVNKNEQILVYHNQWLSIPIRWAKRIKKFKIILEVEEIYGKTRKFKNILNKWEEGLIRNADNYIAVSDILANYLGEKTKLVLYGSYFVPQLKLKHQNEQHINLIYTGLIDEVTGSAFNAIKCMKYLTDEYRLHICGYGKISEIKKLEKMIFDINSKLNRNACLFYGLLPENELKALLFRCQVAVNPQNLGSYMDSAFPSKIVSYLSYNLRVVSSKIESVEQSLFASYIKFTNDNTPNTLAKAILSLDFDLPFNSRDFIFKLDKKIVTEMSNLFK